MCGITGIINKSFLYNGDLESPIRKMCASLIHRGPENSGFWIDNDRGVALGHQRLSILELSNAGNQPMQNGNTWNQHLSGSQDYSTRLWGILMFQAWYEKQKHLN